MQMHQSRRRLQPAAHIELLPIRIAHGGILAIHAACGRDLITAPFHFGNGVLDRLRHDHDQSPFLVFGLLLLESSRQATAEAPAIGIAHLPKRLCGIFLLGTDLPASACDAIIGVEKRQLAEFEIVLYSSASVSQLWQTRLCKSRDPPSKKLLGLPQIARLRTPPYALLISCSVQAV